ncbi:MAG: hypothetical protein KBA51_08490 [Kiritimatiellae bacterium]|nr:hypothetical protein [Kiritimatiellia bacterium]
MDTTAAFLADAAGFLVERTILRDADADTRAWVADSRFVTRPAALRAAEEALFEGVAARFFPALGRWADGRDEAFLAGAVRLGARREGAFFFVLLPISWTSHAIFGTRTCHTCIKKAARECSHFRFDCQGECSHALRS